MLSAVQSRPSPAEPVPAEGPSAEILCLEHGTLAVALVEATGGAVRYASPAFRGWFPPEAAAESWHAWFPKLDRDSAALIAEGRAATTEIEIARGPRRFTLLASFRRVPGTEPPQALIEIADITGQREAEYILDSYAGLADRHARELEREKGRAEKLLLNLMPRSVYEELRENGTTTPQRFESASILMLDLVGFSEMALSRDPSSVVAELNDIFSAFDRIVELFGCERIKTIGDAYMAVSGLPEAAPDHAVNLAKVAIRMRRYLDRRSATGHQAWRCRIGIASGPLVGSIIGIHRYVYDVFGSTVNLASRLEAMAEPAEILLNDAAASQLKDGFRLDPPRSLMLKGIGTYSAVPLIDEARR